jgi:hypothetical protein
VVFACDVCGEYACAAHPPKNGTFTIYYRDGIPSETLHTYTGSPGPAYTFTAKELGLHEPEREAR